MSTSNVSLLFLLVHACDRERIDLRAYFKDPLDELGQHFGQILDQSQLKSGQADLVEIINGTIITNGFINKRNRKFNKRINS